MVSWSLASGENTPANYIRFGLRAEISEGTTDMSPFHPIFPASLAGRILEHFAPSIGDMTASGPESYQDLALPSCINRLDVTP